MTLFKTAALGIAAALVLVLAGGAGAQPLERHSGVIVDANEAAGTIVLAEVGPWRVRDGRTVITRRTITFTPRTEFAIAFRAEGPNSGFTRRLHRSAARSLGRVRRRPRHHRVPPRRDAPGGREDDRDRSPRRRLLTSPRLSRRARRRE